MPHSVDCDATLGESQGLGVALPRKQFTINGQLFQCYTGCGENRIAKRRRTRCRAGFADTAGRPSRPPYANGSDIGMPDLSGYEVAERIRLEPWGEHMTLIALTGWGQEGDKRRAQAAGLDPSLYKTGRPR